ncbi:MAG: J domain-containing protein [Pseudomonadota bacterium]
MEVTASPLTWPDGWERTKRRKNSQFGDHSIAKAIKYVLHELELMGYPSWNVIISSDLKLRQDGLPYSSQKKPDDPGVSVWFRKCNETEKQRKVIAKDLYTDIADNLWAIGKVLEAMRGIERWGGGDMLNRMFTGFVALPDPESINSMWRSILGYDGHDLSECEHAYRVARSKAHPDKGGSEMETHHVNQAWKQARVELSQ